jgi:xylulose-5-phosphate/fructose-6-phosphate phosphoketolase
MPIDTIIPDLLHETPESLNNEESLKTANTLSPELLHKMNAYWRAANYVSVGQIYLYKNPLLKEPLTRRGTRPWRSGDRG